MNYGEESEQISQYEASKSQVTTYTTSHVY